MQFDLEEVIESIKTNQTFLKLKKIIENNAGHDHEVEYDHCIKTYEVARDSINGKFIINADAKKRFEDFLNENIDGVKKRDILQIGTLIHDIGKLTIFDDNKPLGEKNPDGTFGLFPQHGYWGSKLVRIVTEDAKLPEEVLKYLETFVDFHVVAADIWLAEKNITLDEMIWKTKLATRNLLPDLLFSMYCDFYYHPLFQQHKQTMVNAFNNPQIYTPIKSSIIE